jgi:hypothetical protein
MEFFFFSSEEKYRQEVPFFSREHPCVYLNHTRRVNSLSPKVVKFSLTVIVVESEMKCDERTGALALTLL